MRYTANEAPQLLRSFFFFHFLAFEFLQFLLFFCFLPLALNKYRNIQSYRNEFMLFSLLSLLKFLFSLYNPRCLGFCLIQKKNSSATASVFLFFLFFLYVYVFALISWLCTAFTQSSKLCFIDSISCAYTLHIELREAPRKTG